MKNYKVLPELSRRLFVTHQTIHSDKRLPPHRLEQLNWLREAYADALSMVLQELLCETYPNMKCLSITKEQALKFARMRSDENSKAKGWPDLMILGYVLDIPIEEITDDNGQHRPNDAENGHGAETARQPHEGTAPHLSCAATQGSERHQGREGQILQERQDQSGSDT